MFDLRASEKDPYLTIDEEVWRPNPGPQTLLVSCPVKEVFYGGARGGGKTDGLLGDFLEHAHTYGFAARGIFFRRTYPELEDVIRRSQEIYYRAFPRAVYLSGSKTWFFPNGAILRMRHMEREDDAMHYQGQSYSWIALDELTTWPDSKCYDKIKICGRSAQGAKVSIRCSGNPGGPGHHWVKARFIDGCAPFQIQTDDQGLERVFIPSFVWDNPKWEQRDPTYVSTLKGIPDKALRRAWYLGDWDAFIGQVFEEWRRDLHTIKPFSIPDHWRRFVSCDWGYATPFAIHWYAIDGEGRIWMYREWYGQKDGAAVNTGLRMTADLVGKQILEIEKQSTGKEEIEYRELSPDAWIKKGQPGPSVAESFDDVDVLFNKASNDRLQGLYQCHLRLRHQGKDGQNHIIRPMFVAFDTCVNFIRSVPPLQHDKNAVEDVDKSSGVEDHSYESWRYGMMSRPLATPDPIPEEKKWVKKKRRIKQGSWKTV